MSCVWQWMKKLMWAGYGHRTGFKKSNSNIPKSGNMPDTGNFCPPSNGNELAPGTLANFCPSCPQPDINLPNDWKDDPVGEYLLVYCYIANNHKLTINRWVYQCFFVADSNFKVDHVKQKNYLKYSLKWRWCV